MSPTLPWPAVGATFATQVYLATLEVIATLPLEYNFPEVVTLPAVTLPVVVTVAELR